MFGVDIDKIIPVTDARANISALVSEVEKGHTYVLTRGGKPVVALVSINFLNQNKPIFKSVKSSSSKPKIPQPVSQVTTTDEEDIPAIDLNKVNQAIAQYEQSNL